MPRYIILEVPDDQTDDLVGLVEIMRNGQATLKAAGLVLDVKIPERFDAYQVGEIEPATGLTVYVAQGA